MTLAKIKLASATAKAWATVYGVFNDTDGVEFIGMDPHVDYVKGNVVTSVRVHVRGVDAIARTAGTRLYGRRMGRGHPHTDTVIDGVLFQQPIYKGGV